MPTDTTWQFETKRLAASPWRHAVPDRSQMVGIVARLLTPKVTASLPDRWRGTYSQQRAAGWLDEVDNEASVLLVTGSKSGKAIGLMIVYEDSSEPSRRSVRIGYLVAESEWSRGYATEILRGFVERCRAVGNVTVLAGVDEANAASRRVLEKCGLEPVAHDLDAAQMTYRLET